MLGAGCWVLGDVDVDVHVHVDGGGDVDGDVDVDVHVDGDDDSTNEDGQMCAWRDLLTWCCRRGECLQAITFISCTWQNSARAKASTSS